MKKILLYTFCFIVTINAWGQSPVAEPAIPDTVGTFTILFRFSKADVDSSFMDNAKKLKALHDVMSDREFVSRLDSVIITAAASPEGAPEYNRQLALRRAIAMKNHITGNYPYVDFSMISARADARYWEGLIGLVEADPDVPSKDEFLDMLKNPSLSDEEKNRRMIAMREGAVFAYIRDRYILRRLRYGSAGIVFYSPVQTPPQTPEPIPAADPAPEAGDEPVSAFEPIVEAVPPPAVRRKTVFALRTNLLLDAVGGSNLGIEVPLGKHFSVAGDFAYAYTRINNYHALQTIRYTLEGRYWFKPRKNALTGWNIGVYGTYCSRFDLQWGGGWQGDGYRSAGLSAGYSARLSRRFNLDLSLLAGYVYAPEVRHYGKPQDGHLIWEKTVYHAKGFFPTQVRVNFVWLICKKEK